MTASTKEFGYFLLSFEAVTVETTFLCISIAESNFKKKTCVLRSLQIEYIHHIEQATLSCG